MRLLFLRIKVRLWLTVRGQRFEDDMGWSHVVLQYPGINVYQHCQAHAAACSTRRSRSMRPADHTITCGPRKHSHRPNRGFCGTTKAQRGGRSCAVTHGQNVPF